MLSKCRLKRQYPIVPLLDAAITLLNLCWLFCPVELVMVEPTAINSTESLLDADITQLDLGRVFNTVAVVSVEPTLINLAVADHFFTLLDL